MILTSILPRQASDATLLAPLFRHKGSDRVYDTLMHHHPIFRVNAAIECFVLALSKILHIVDI